MIRSFSTFTKRTLLAASIGLLAVHAPTAIFAADGPNPQVAAADTESDADSSLTESADEEGSNKQDGESEKSPPKQLTINLAQSSEVPQAQTITIQSGVVQAVPAQPTVIQGTAGVVTNGVVGGSVSAASGLTVDQNGNHFFFVQRGSPSTQALPLPYGFGTPKPFPAEVEGRFPGAGAVAVSPYWIGAELRPLNETVRWMLKLPEGRGIAVFKIMPESSAEKAGLKERDILIKADEKVLAVPAQLMEILAKSEGKELKITYIRDLDMGKEITTTVKPDKRMESKEAAAVINSAGKGTVTVIRGANNGNSYSGDVLTFSPQAGFAIPPTLGQKTVQPLQSTVAFPTLEMAHEGMRLVVRANDNKLPDGLSISITRTGDKPAEIKVKQGDKSWEVTDKELDNLPEEIRMHVQRSFSLGAGPGDARFFMNAQPVTGNAAFTTTTPATQIAPGQPFTIPLASPPNAEAIRKQAEEHHKKVQEEIAKIQAANEAAIKKQMQDLQKQVDQIQKQLEKKKD